jgi:hypothetical protein
MPATPSASQRNRSRIEFQPNPGAYGMIRVIFGVLAFFVLIAIYAASPYLGLYRILSAVQTRNAPALELSPNFGDGKDQAAAI